MGDGCGGTRMNRSILYIYILYNIFCFFFVGSLQLRFVAPRQTTNIHVGGTATISLRVSKQSATGGMIVGHRVGEVLRNWPGLALIVLLVFCRA